MQQVSFKVKSLDDVRAFYHRLQDAGMKIDRTVTHGIACSVYFYDPEGNRIELYYTTPFKSVSRSARPSISTSPTPSSSPSRSRSRRKGPPRGAQHPVG